jgi:PhnB protein
MPVKPRPDRYHTVTPYLTVQGVAWLLDFVQRAFDAQELERMSRPDGTIGHAEVRIGDSVVMMGEARAGSPPMPSTLYLYVSDTDATFKRTVAAGAAPLMEPADQFCGDRNAAVKDPVGNHWWIATHKEDVSRQEMARRAAAQMK